MKKLILFLMFSTLFFTSSCDDNDDHIFCSDQFVFGLNVIVLDAVTGNPIFQDIEVKAVDGMYQELLELVPGLEYAFVGAGERAGTYVVTITKLGYQTYTSVPIVLTRDECHVIPKFLTVNLQSN